MRYGRQNCRMWAVVEALENRWLLNGSIVGKVIDETNGNAGMSGVTVYIDADDDRIFDSGETRVTTNAAGRFEFTNLASGLYMVRQVVPPEYEEASSQIIVGLSDGQIFEIYPFHNVHYWMVEGTSSGDIITAKVDPGGAKVTVNGVSEVRSLGNIRAIVLSGRGGNERISVDSQLQFTTRILGGGGDDTLLGGPKEDSIFGGQGNESIRAGAGNDSIEGGGGNDRISAGGGNDMVKGDWGNDFIYGGGGNDTILGSRDSDKIYGGPGDDSLDGSDGDDSLFGGDGRDTLDGGRGHDWVRGGNGNDVLF